MVSWKIAMKMGLLLSKKDIPQKYGALSLVSRRELTWHLRGIITRQDKL